MGWLTNLFCGGDDEQAPEPVRESHLDVDQKYYDGSIGGRGGDNYRAADLPHAEGEDPGEPMPTFYKSREFPGGHPGSGKRR